MTAEGERHNNHVPGDFSGSLRLDRYVSEVWGLIGRSQLKVRMRGAWINGRAAKVSSPVLAGDNIDIDLAPIQQQDLEPQDMNLVILFENSDVIVLNKRAGIVVHPAAGNYQGTLVHGLLFHTRDLAEQGFEDESRPGIVHRLDKDTSGVMIVAKNPAAHGFLSAQFQERSTAKEYLAIVRGQPRQQRFAVDGYLHRDPQHRQRYVYDEVRGKEAHTDFEVLKSSGDLHLLKAWPKTGRTHQIRVHASHCGLPLIGDAVYGTRRTELMAPRCMLHAASLSITLPGHESAMTFSAEPPEDFKESLIKANLI